MNATATVIDRAPNAHTCSGRIRPRDLFRMLNGVTRRCLVVASVAVVALAGCASAPAAPTFGEASAVRTGDVVRVSAMTAMDEHGNMPAKDDAAEQTRLALANMDRALRRVGASMQDVVRTRLYVTDASRFAEFAQGHSAWFRDIRPASLLVEVAALSHPDALVAVEAEAIVAGPERERTLVSSGTRWEPWFGYSRAVKVGNTIHVSGTTAWNAAGEIVGDGDYYLQARQSLANIRDWLRKAGADMSDVVRTRVYTRDVAEFEAIARAHREFFGAILPATTLLEINGLAEDDMLVEIEAVAVIDDDRARVATGTKWESLYGYSRAVRAGDQVHVSATAAWNPATGRVDGDMDFEAQARQILENLQAALDRAGADLGDVVHSRIFTTDITRTAAIARLYRSALGRADAALTLIETSRMTEPEIKLEIEVDAVLGNNSSKGNNRMQDITSDAGDGLVHIGLTLPEDATAPLATQAASVFTRILSDAAAQGVPSEYIVRTRLFVSDIADFKPVAGAHAEAFGALAPATAMVQLAAMPADGVRIAAEAVGFKGNRPATTRSGSPLEKLFGYSNAVRAGEHLFITGTVGTNANGKIPDPDDYYAQTMRALEKTRAIAAQAGARLEDVVHTRLFIRDFAGFEEVARAHREVFGDIRPATTLIEVDRLFTPEMAVEVEADLYLGEKRVIGSDSKWEPWFGFSRSSLAGRRLRISGSTGSGANVIEQTRAVLDNLERAAQKAGHSLADAVAIRVFAVDAARHAEDIRRVIAERVDPDCIAWSLIHVDRLAGDDMLVEIEAETVRTAPSGEWL